MINKYVWKRFLIVLKDRDYSALGRAVVYVLFPFMGLFFVLPTILILWILKPIVWLKVGKLPSDRIGHLVMNTDLFLRRRQLGIYPDGPHYCFLISPKGLANRQLLTMFKRVIPIYENRPLTLMFIGMLPIIKRTPFYQDLPLNSNEYYEFNNAKPSLYFTPDEVEKGRRILDQMGVDTKEVEFVCIFSRDDAYLKNIVPHNNWDYHNSRNADIDGLIESTKYLIKKGFTVIRIGSIVKKPINFSHEKLIDYPFSKYQSDFMDIFLLAHCKFTLGSGASGLVGVAQCFDTPVLQVNSSECYKYTPITKNCLYLPKKYKYRNSNNYIHFKDAIKFGSSWHDHQADLNLEAEENSPQEILEATEEMLARLENKFSYSSESEKLIQSYYKLWAGSDTIGSCKTPIGIAWLKKYQDLYF
jgi:putative glycosyltransferase (TIGR04372 family)